MRPLKIVAPLAALALLTSACGLFTHHAGKPALRSVWKFSDGTLDTNDASLVGDTVIADVVDKRGKPKGSGTAVFINARTGRIRGRATNLVGDNEVSPETDKHGRPLVGLGSSVRRPDEVYDPSGHLVWQAPSSEAEQFTGGYTTERQKSAGKYWEVIRTTSGRTITRLPAPRKGTNPEPGYHSAEPAFQAVRPGLLVAIGLGASGSQAALIDVSRPGHARLRPLHPPPTPSHSGPINPQEVAVGSEHLYVSWGAPDIYDDPHTRYLAGYDVSDAHLAWHRTLPIRNAYYKVLASTSGEENLAVEQDDVAGGEERIWFLRPDTGAVIGPTQGRDGNIQPLDSDPGRQGPGLVGGRAYIESSISEISEKSSTQVIDPHTARIVRTISDPYPHSFLGATSSGDLIYAGPDGLYAYR